MKTIVITGASSGIGKATAKYFIKKGWQVAATMRQPEREQELNHLAHVELFQLDVTDEDSINRAFDEIKGNYGTIDAFFNNAGYCLFGPLELSTPEQIKQTLEVNLVGATLVIRKFIPLLRENGGGTILATSSVGGRVSLPLTPTYHAAKFGLEGLVEGLSYELYPFNINCKVLEPGGIKTDFWGRSAVTAPGLNNSPYAKDAEPYIKQMTQVDPQNDHRADPIEVAKVAYEAITDGKRKWRYPVVSKEFIAQRFNMSDEDWIKQVLKNYEK